MRKGIYVFLALALLVGLTAGASDAWVRSKMFDAVAPLDPLQSNAGFLGWGAFDGIETSGLVDYLPGEIIGPTSDLRVAYCVAFGANELQPDETIATKLKYRTDHQPSWPFDNTKKTSVLWSFYINGDSKATRCPQVCFRLLSGEVKISYTNVNVTGAGPRGWYVDSGTVDAGSGAVLITDTGKYGIAMEPAEWHTMRLTFDPATNRWDLSFDGGASGHISGTAGSSIGSYVQWPRIDRSKEKCKFWTEYFYWGQGDAEIADGLSNPTVNGQGTFSSDPTPVVNGSAATIAWTSTVAGTSKIVWDKKFHGLAHTVNMPGSATTSHSYTITDLEPSATYTFYVETTDGTNTWASGLKQFRTEKAVTETLGNTGFEEGADIYPWVSCVLPESPDLQRWGGNYWQWNLDQFAWYNGTTNQWDYTAVVPRSEGGRMWSGSCIGGNTKTRDYAALAQQVSVTPGKVYKATVQFWGNVNTTDPNATLADASARVGLDPNGGTDAGHFDGANWVKNDDVVWGPWTYRPNPAAGWQTVTALAYAKSNAMTVFLQQHYSVSGSTSATWLAFDDVTFGESDIIPPVDPGQTKKWIPGFMVTLKDVIITNRFDNTDGSVVAYVEDADRVAGIRVVADSVQQFPWEIWLGDTVDVTGTLVVNANRELEIKASSVAYSASPAGISIYAVGLNNKSIGGSVLGEQVGVAGSAGANNVGLYVRTWGKVTAVVQDVYDFSIFLDDGSGMTGGANGVQYQGVEVKIPMNSGYYPGQFQVGTSYVLASGTCSLKLFDPDNNPSTNNSVVKPVILVRPDPNTTDVTISPF